jgi:hypothetical protein
VCTADAFGEGRPTCIVKVHRQTRQRTRLEQNGFRIPSPERRSLAPLSRIQNGRESRRHTSHRSCLPSISACSAPFPHQQFQRHAKMSFSSSMDDCAPVQFLPAVPAAPTAFHSFAALHAAESSPLHSRTPSPQDFAAAAHSSAFAAASSSSHRQCMYAPQPQQHFSNFSVAAPAGRANASHLVTPPPFAIVAGWAHVAGNMFHCPQTRTSLSPRIFFFISCIGGMLLFLRNFPCRCLLRSLHRAPSSGAKHICDMNCEARQWCPIRSVFVCAISGKVHARGNPFLVRESKRQCALVDDSDDGADEFCATADANSFGFEREGQIHAAARRKFM